jgi:hypothetical protein
MDAVRTSPQTLGRAECLDLLRAGGLGRVAYSQRALPAIVVVTYSLIDETLALRVDARAPELPSLRGAVVAFQTEHTSPITQLGWSITCVGQARPVTDPVRIEGLVASALDGEGADAVAASAFLLLDPELCEGRLFHELSLTAGRRLSGAAVPTSAGPFPPPARRRR